MRGEGAGFRDGVVVTWRAVMGEEPPQILSGRGVASLLLSDGTGASQRAVAKYAT